jgi:Tol biopolymer transport system component/DNA-binding winged helix-turn-helix (wHTH) protein
MYGSERSAQIVRFGIFEADLETGELRKNGVKVPLQGQPFQVCALLLEHAGELVTREELRQKVWPEDTFVDFEQALNTAIAKIRLALGDEAVNPRFVETLPRRGYRFIGPVTKPDSKVVAQPAAPAEAPVTRKGWFERPTARRSWLLAATTLLILLSGFGIWRSAKNRADAPPPIEAAPPNKLTVVPFTTFPGFEIAPSFSPDGNEIVFSWFGYEKEFQFDLYIKQVGQEHVVQLTHHPAIFLGSAWSPDGRLIAFMRLADPEGTGIYVISPLGGAERKVASITAYRVLEALGVSWSADGKWLAFSKGNSLAKKAGSSADHFSIHLVNVETTEERLLPDPSKDCGNTWQPSFSPDGKYLASVCVLAEGVAKIYLQTPDGKQARELKDARSSEGFAGIAWAEDSQSLVYSADQHLWRIPLAGGKPEMLLFAQDVESVAVASHGNRLAFAQVHHPGQVFQLALASPTKLTAPAAKLISSTRGDAGAHVSPDGKHIAFQSWRSGNPEVWVCDRDASNPVQLTSFGGPSMGEPRWSPDGRVISRSCWQSGACSCTTPSNSTPAATGHHSPITKSPPA